MASMDLKTGNKLEGQGQAPFVSQCRRGKERESEGSIFGSAVCDGALVGLLDCNLASLVCVTKRGRADGGGRGQRRVEIIFRTVDGSHAHPADMSAGPDQQPEGR